MPAWEGASGLQVSFQNTEIKLPVTISPFMTASCFKARGLCQRKDSVDGPPPWFTKQVVGAESRLCLWPMSSGLEPH